MMKRITAEARTLDIPRSSHAVLFYEREEEKHGVVFPFIKAGLDRGEAAIYLSDEENVETIRRGLEVFGVDVEAHRGLRVVDSEEWYLEHGTMNKRRVVEKWMDAVRQAEKGGYKGLRITGEPTCFFENNLVDSWMDYESSLPRRFDFPMTAICRYKLSDVTSYDEGRLLPDLLRIHNYTITPKLAKEIDFPAYYLDSVNEILGRTLGDTTRQVVLQYLEDTHGLSRLKIPERIPEFRRALEGLLGVGGTSIELEILKDLYNKAGLRYNIRGGCPPGPSATSR